jgi:uncharacterized protein (DUF885 family)
VARAAFSLLALILSSPHVAADSPKFAQFVDAYFDARFQSHPSEATGAGFHHLDGALESLDANHIRERAGTLRHQLAQLAEIEKSDALTFDESIDATMIRLQIQSELQDLTELRTWESNPMVYAGLPGGAIDLLIKRDFAPAKDRLKNVVARERQIPIVFAAAKANLKNPPKEFTDLAIRMTRGSIGFFEGSVNQWAETAAGDDKVLLAEFKSANSTVVAELKSLAEWLENDLKPRSNGNYAIGATAFINKLKHDEMIESSLSEILKRGEANLERDHNAFIETAKKIDPSKPAAEVMKRLSDDHPTADDLIPSVQRSVEAARQYLIEKDLVTIPSEVRPRIEETPPYARNGGFASMDTPGPYESKATEAFYYVTPVETDWDANHVDEHLRLFNSPVVAMINVHEAYPGHYLQFLYAPRYPTKTRKLLFCGTNAEGWAHYTEQMMVDQGFGGGDPKIRLAQLQEALLRDCRYVAGIKLHTEGWTVERAAKELFEKKGFQEPANAFEEARRGSYNPTYLYYTYGKLDIQQLRDDYLARHPKATLKDFHDAFVAQGALPIPLVRRILLR